MPALEFNTTPKKDEPVVKQDVREVPAPAPTPAP